MEFREADNPVNSAIPICSLPRSGGSVLRHPTFDWKAADKHHELYNFGIEVMNIFITNNYTT